MSRTRVVLACSDHAEDAAALASLKTQLAPLEREGLLECWDETLIEAGAVRHDEIRRAVQSASAAVLIVSPDFLASEALMRHVVEPLVERAGVGDLLLIPVFWRPSAVAHVGIGPRKVTLTQYAGYGSPDRPLSALTYTDREREIAKLAEKLAAVAGLRTETTPRPPSGAGATATAATTSATVEREYALSIRLEQQGDTLAVGYHVPGVATLASATRPWSDAAPALAIGERLDCERLDRVEVALAAHGEEWGARLFDLLFGPDAQWSRVLRAVYGVPEGDAQPAPLRAGVRVRIGTADAALAALPWRLTRWRERPLMAGGLDIRRQPRDRAGAQRHHDRARQRAHPRPARGAGARHASRCGAREGAARGAGARVERREGGLLARGRHAQGARQRAQRAAPHLLYVFAHAVPGSDPPALLLDDGGDGRTTLRPDELAALFAEAGHAPAVVYLNVTGVTYPSQLAPPLRAAVPLVVWRRLAEPTAATGRVAAAWLQRWLGQVEDPVAALHALRARDGETDAELATLGLHATYARWRTDRAAGFVARPKVHLPLDRDKQKALVGKHVVELARSDTRRVMALVAYAAPGNSAGAFSRQLLHYLEMAAGDAAVIEPRSLHFPMSRADLATGLKHHLRLLLDADEREPDGHLLRRHGPRVVTGRRRPMLWLDWARSARRSAASRRSRPRSSATGCASRPSGSARPAPTTCAS